MWLTQTKAQWDETVHLSTTSLHKKLTTTCSSDKAPTPCKSEKQPQLKHETPVKPLPSPYLLSTPKRIIRPSLKLKETQTQLNLASLGMLVFGLLLHVTYSSMQKLHVVFLLQKKREMLLFCYWHLRAYRLGMHGDLRRSIKPVSPVECLLALFHSCSVS